MHQPLIAPSLLSADFTRLQEDIGACVRGGADIIHVDVMDGVFVPPITFGSWVIPTLKKLTSLPLDVHLMVQQPDAQVEQFAEAGAHMISVHAEVCNHLHRTLSRIRGLGAKAGVVLNPATPLDFAYEAAEGADYMLLMSVNPGYGGQSFIPSFLGRCERLRTWLNANGFEHVQLEVDGGIKISNAREVYDAGANMIVSGSGLMVGNIEENVKAMKAALQ